MNSGVPGRAFWRHAADVAACGVVCLYLVCLAGCALPWQKTITTPANAIRAGDDQNGKSITLEPGQTLTVTLGSTYWTIQGSSNPQVLAPVGEAGASHGSCPAGAGCGTVWQEFRAVGPGTAQVTASRVSCGEAMRCVGSSGHYQLTVQVTAAGAGAYPPKTQGAARIRAATW